MYFARISIDNKSNAGKAVQKRNKDNGRVDIGKISRRRNC
jgi:hypothetical protein